LGSSIAKVERTSATCRGDKLISANFAHVPFVRYTTKVALPAAVQLATKEGVQRILLIEDHAPMRRNLATMLEMEGFDVLVAENGRAGVDVALAELPDLVLCDVMMPELDGHGVLKELRANKSTATTPFIFLTAKGEKPDVRAGMNLGADDYLTKPAVKSDLLAAIRARFELEAARERELDAKVAEARRFAPNFDSPVPLQQRLGLTEREAEVLLWVAQGKSNGEIGIICGAAEKTIKRHLTNIYMKLGVEGRNAASLRALEVLNGNNAGAN
jgi:DNA-binding NarL/FixJ family response regulator